MKCPKCQKETAVLVTTEAKRKSRDGHGVISIIWKIIFPVYLLILLWHILFGRRQTYYKKQHYHCNYCGHDFGADFVHADDNDGEATTTKKIMKQKRKEQKKGL